MAAQLGSCATCCRKQAISRRPAEHLTAGIDGASVKAKRNALGQGRQFAILKGVSKDSEVAANCSESYGIPTDMRSKRYRRFCAAVAADQTGITVSSDGEDGLRGVVGWFETCRHLVNWSIAAIGENSQGPFVSAQAFDRNSGCPRRTSNRP
jgi:hypothetical protein